jgi:diaminopimelate epimerase
MIPFVKTQALGNDFLLVEQGRVKSDYSELARRICDRNFGVGADGLILWNLAGEVFKLRIFNRDGSEAECSGNGLRCAAAYFIESRRWPHDRIQLETVSGVYSLKRTGEQYEADMGVPGLAPEQIPFIPPAPMSRVVNHPMRANGETVYITACSTGNPHCSLFVETLDDRFVERIGPQLENNPAFPNRTNVEFIHVLNRSEIEVAFWERGVGPTFASGTGSCGATVACILSEKTERRVTVHTKAGKLLVEWPPDGRLRLTSTASVVAEGNYFQAS